jgi:uncharacterized membrane protein YGL010W
MALGSARTWDDWIAEYGQSHHNPINRGCHAIGIPLIALSLPWLAITLLMTGHWRVPLAAFAIGWAFQLIGHAFERKPPEFLKDPRFLFVGLRWWFAKIGSGE